MAPVSWPLTIIDHSLNFFRIREARESLTKPRSIPRVPVHTEVQVRDRSSCAHMAYTTVDCDLPYTGDFSFLFRSDPRTSEDPTEYLSRYGSIQVSVNSFYPYLVVNFDQRHSLGKSMANCAHASSSRCECCWENVFSVFRWGATMYWLQDSCSLSASPLHWEEGKAFIGLGLE